VSEHDGIIVRPKVHEEQARLFNKHVTVAPLTSIFSHGSGCSLSSGRRFALAVFHAPFVLDLAGFCGIASRASVPLVATLLAAVGLLRPREI